jgi:hypothetical protein
MSPMSSGGDQSSEGSATRAVSRFYRVKFVDERRFRLWTERVVEFTSALRELLPDRLDMRPVIFVPVQPAPGAPIYAYVSAGVRGLAADISDGATVEPAPVNIAELPNGLTILFGEAIDAVAYAKRHT